MDQDEEPEFTRILWCLLCQGPVDLTPFVMWLAITFAHDRKTTESFRFSFLSLLSALLVALSKEFKIVYRAREVTCKMVDSISLVMPLYLIPSEITYLLVTSDR